MAYYYYREYYPDSSSNRDVSNTYASTWVRPNTVVFAVFLYALLPIIKNTYTGITEVDYNIKDAGKGMGMTKNQVMRMIELPLSLSVIIGGIRIALVVAIGIVAIGSFIELLH